MLMPSMMEVGVPSRQEGSTMTGANGEVGPFETTVDLEPGSWTVAVFESSAMDGQPLNLVSATITVK